ncbi:MAG: bifunctional GNAT family N-acetyltransferase/carbon-nitrogen hydrolase family protein [Campylobacterales bacterium]
MKKRERKLRHSLKLRNLAAGDFGAIKAIMDRIYHQLGGSWSEAQYKSLLARFPAGQLCIDDNGRVVAAALSIIVDYNRFGDRHTYAQITGNGSFVAHDYEGDTLYGIDLFVDPDYRGLRLGRRLYDARKELCQNLGLRRIIVGGRIPGYHRYSTKLTPQKYVQLVKERELADPVLSFQLANDFHIRRLITGYLEGDEESCSYAVLLEWNNIDYKEISPLFGARKSVVRVGVVQSQMRSVASLEELMKQVEFFVDAMAGYKSDFIIFPEYLSAPLMALYDQKTPSEAIRLLASQTEKIRDAFSEMALSYNVNIIAGSMPEYDGRNLYNVSWLCRRDGSIEAQYKLHVTPDETAAWGLKGGEGLRVFETDVGKIGILVCYDIEFPELSRLLALQGVEILFVPFWTDTKNGYLRVRRCAQARAIENECYTVIAGSVGNLPNVENMDIQYAQSAIFSPSDFAFPHDAIIAEATPNTEMTLVADLDLELLRKLRRSGSVRNLANRRTDLYTLTLS